MPKSSFATVLAIAAVVVPFLVSYKMGGWVSVYTSHGFFAENVPDLRGKVAIVTGANTGIGKVTVRDLARKGAHVLLASRSVIKGEEARRDVCEVLQKEGAACLITILPLDLSSLDSVLKFSNEIKENYKRIDILILNAGIMFGDYETTSEGYERQWGTNHLGHFFLVEQLISVLTQSKARVVSVSSSAHRHPYPHGIEFDQLEDGKNYNPFLAYGQSKLSNILFARELSERYSSTGLTSNSLHPGVIKTELTRHLVNDINSFCGEFFGGIIVKVIDTVWQLVFMNADQGALTQLYVATAPALEGVTGKYFEPVGVEVTPSAFARDGALQKKLWEVSAAMTSKYLASKGLSKQ